jgi:hypothetical protein
MGGVFSLVIGILAISRLMLCAQEKLQIYQSTNNAATYTAKLVIRPPANDTNITYDLLYTHSLDKPVNWQYFQRCVFTNVTASGMCKGTGFFALIQTNGNLNVTYSSAAQELALLLVPMPGLLVTNATYTGASPACGTFSGGNGCGLPIDSGVILSSGDVMSALGPNNAPDTSTDFFDEEGGNYNGDPDLDNLVGGGQNTFDAAVLEFDVIATNSFILQFRYIFASEEYPEYIGENNDPMAIFVSTNRVAGAWVNSITNDYALVPGTTNVPVSVNTINGGYNNGLGDITPPTNPQYYVDNDDPGYMSATNAAPVPEFNTQYNGMTVLLTAQTIVSANVTNHVKIAVADYGDPFLDSAVFVTPAKLPCY